MQEWDERNPKTHKGYDLRKMPMAALYKEYGPDPMTVDFIGHAIALHRCRPWGLCLPPCTPYLRREAVMRLGPCQRLPHCYLAAQVPWRSHLRTANSIRRGKLSLPWTLCAANCCSSHADLRFAASDCSPCPQLGLGFYTLALP